MKEEKKDLLNKYIDNELDSNELNEFTSLIEQDENLVKDLKAMRIVEQSLRKMEFDKSPSDVTFKVMKKVLAPKPVKRSYWFFWLCMFVFMAALGVCTYFAIESYVPVKDSGSTEQVVDTVKNFIGDQTKTINSLVKSPDFKLISLVLMLLVVITGYFVIDTHRNLKNKLNHL
jgi:hypothetical protein